jgi:hypothetical protein
VVDLKVVGGGINIYTSYSKPVIEEEDDISENFKETNLFNDKNDENFENLLTEDEEDEEFNPIT